LPVIKGSFGLAAWLRSRSEDEFEVAAITIAELWHGVERAADEQQRINRETFLRRLTSVLPIIPYAEQTAHVHARLWAQLQSKGVMPGYYDLIVAAAALERGSAVATFNVSHFSRVPGLNVITPS